MKMKLNKSTILLINTVVGLVGVILVLVSVNVENNPKLQTMLEAIGTSLIASGGVNFLDKLLNQDSNDNKSLTENVSIMTHTRSKITSDVHERKYSAKKVDIVGVNLSDCLHEIVDDPRQRMIKRVFSGHAERLRLLFVHPNAPFVKQRALEDNMSEAELKRRQKESIKLCIKFYKNLRERHDKAISNNDFDNKASFVEIRLIDFCPHITVERFDDETYWGLYTSDTVGLNSPMFRVTKEQNDVLFEQLKKHFSGLMVKSLESSDNVLLRMTMDELTFNTTLAESLLDADELKALLQQ